MRALNNTAELAGLVLAWWLDQDSSEVTLPERSARRAVFGLTALPGAAAPAASAARPGVVSARR